MYLLEEVISQKQFLEVVLTVTLAQSIATALEEWISPVLPLQQEQFFFSDPCHLFLSLAVKT